MIREPKNVDFYTTGRHPSAEEFAKISELIEKLKRRSKQVKRSDGKGRKKVSLSTHH